MKCPGYEPEQVCVQGECGSHRSGQQTAISTVDHSATTPRADDVGNNSRSQNPLYGQMDPSESRG